MKTTPLNKVHNIVLESSSGKIWALTYPTYIINLSTNGLLIFATEILDMEYSLTAPYLGISIDQS